MSEGGSSQARLGAQRFLLFTLFAISGFAGLIYESIWTHYLKLLLGHSADAQTLVLVLFMGGMAIGAWLCGRISSRLRRPLLAYAAVELALALLALGFDPAFRVLSAWILDTAAPALANPTLIDALKWAVSGLMILPACVLLGATFPLISAGVIRLAPDRPGHALGLLYFSNSLGAAVGVLTSGFLLIAWLGLPGTLLTAAGCNLALALAVGGIALLSPRPPGTAVGRPSAAEFPRADEARHSIGILLGVAFLTGLSSFLYEVGWIRMLSLVLGSATHSFELMLGAFILGLALGAFWIRHRIERVASPLYVLAWVQVLMGGAALLTLGVYRESFDWMGQMVTALPKTDGGYAAFNVLSQGICLALMLPVTILAGMTLPITTAVLLRSGLGESAIGRVYAANTVGAIAGILLAVHLLMPVLGLRTLIIAGALIDLGLGVVLLRASGIGLTPKTAGGLAFVLSGSLAIIVLWPFDLQRMSSGVYRYGDARNKSEVIWHADGRTASIDVTRDPKDGFIAILTNGKADASLLLDGVANDEHVQIMTGLLPLALRPDATKVAVIGMGSGRSTHTFLGAPTLQVVDTIEIEPAMVEGARHFGALVDRAFSDPRSLIHFDDAKTFFSRHQKRYDVIMSEPSNPWVSGVASLFSVEFYRQAKAHLAPGGLFVQWLQVYEFDDSLVASVLAALELEFSDYAIYMPDNGNLLIVAVAEGAVPEPQGTFLEWPQVRSLAGLIGVRVLDDLRIRRLAGRADVSSHVHGMAIPPNSDYFPYLDQRAAKFRFLQQRADGLTSAHSVLHRMATDPEIEYRHVTGTDRFAPSVAATEASMVVTLFLARADSTLAADSRAATSEIRAEVDRATMILRQCSAADVKLAWRVAIDLLGYKHWPYMAAEDAVRVTAILRANTCEGPARADVDRWLDLLDAVALRQSAKVLSLAEPIAAAFVQDGKQVPSFVARELLLAQYLLAGSEGLRRGLELMADRVPNDASIRYFRVVANG